MLGLAIALLIGQTGTKTNIPLACPEYQWTSAGVPYDQPGGPPRRYLVLSNGPEYITDGYIQPGSDHVNLYRGKIPFEGAELRLRVYIDHIFNPKGKLDAAEVRFCLATRNGGGVPVKIVRRDSTNAVTTPGAYQYIDPGRDLALAHLGQKWQKSLPAGATISVPDESQSGDAADVAATMQRNPIQANYANVVAELDLRADRPQPGRFLIVRTVLRVPGGSLGTCAEETCSDSGAGERGWWPQSDIVVSNDPKHPVVLSPKGSGFAGFLKICERGRKDWAAFNNLTPDGKASITNNPLDRFGTKNSGLWGVNALYRVYYLGDGADSLPFRSGIAGINNASPAGHVVAGPFSEGDDPWGQYMRGQLAVKFPGYIDRRNATDYDIADLGLCGRTDTEVHYFEYFVSAVGASVYPTALVMSKPTKTN